LALDSTGLSAGVDYVAPRNEIEEKLVEIWAEILKIEPDKIGVKDDFIALGGHSLKVIRVISKVQKEFDVKMNIEKFFETPVLEAMAENISNVLWNTSEVNEEELELFKV
jgi:acyl carrier protein